MSQHVVTGSRARGTQLLAFALVLAFGVSCSDSPVSLTDDIEGPVFAIIDGGHNEGNEDVFFLEPLTDFDPTDPKFDGMPNPNLVPGARICRLDVGDGPGTGNPNAGGPNFVHPCVEEIDTLPMVYDMNGGFYRVNLKDAGILDANYHHRIEIVLAGLSLGALRDIDVDDGPSTASCTDEPFCRVNRDGQGRVGVPIKVIIENNAACLALDPTFDPEVDVCATATLNANQPLVVQNVAAATPNTGATISIQSCQNLRERGNGINDHGLGRIDLMTWGPCIEINALDLSTVGGVAELCDAPFEAVDAGQSMTQVNRLTIHQHHVDDPNDPNDDPTDDFALALGHAEGTICDAPALPNGQVYQFTKMQRFARAIRSTWRTVSSHLTELIQPEALTACNRGCSSSGGFRTSYQVAGPAWWEPDPILGLDLGTHDQGTIVTAKAKVSDSGEFDAGGPLNPDAYEGLRVTVTLNGVVQTLPIYSDASGVVEFSFAVEGGTNTVKFEAIGVGSQGAAGTVNNVFAPSMVDPNASSVPLQKGELTFTAIGLVPFEFRVEPIDVFMDDVDNTIATLSTVQVCTVGGAIEGIAVDEIVAVNNNGSFVNLTIADGSSFADHLTDSDGCITFIDVDETTNNALQVNKTGAYRLFVNPVYNERDKVVSGDDESVKFNVRPNK